MNAVRELIAAARQEAQRLRQTALGADDRGALATEATAERWERLADAAEAALNGPV